MSSNNDGEGLGRFDTRSSSSSSASSFKTRHVIVETQEEPSTELGESYWLTTEGYNWVDPQVKLYFSKFRWSTTLMWWLNNIYMYDGAEVEDIVSFERVSALDNHLIAL